MRANLGLTTACCLIGLAWLIAYFMDDSLVGVFSVVGGIIVWLGLLPLAIYRVITRKQLPWRARIIPFYLLLIPPGAIRVLSSFEELTYQPDWIIAKAYDFTGSDEFRLKENSNFEYWRDSPLGASVITKGTYTKNDSTIILHPSAEENELGNLRGFVMRSCVSRNVPFKKPVVLIPLNKQGHKATSHNFYINRRGE